MTDLSGRVLLALAVVVAVARVMGWCAQRVGQPAVMGEIVGGILLGPSVLGAAWPAATRELFPSTVVAVLGVIGQLGLVLFLFLVGLGVDRSVLLGSGRGVLAVTAASVTVPFALGVAVAPLLSDRVAGSAGSAVTFAVFLGTALAVTAFPVLARILRDTGLEESRLGVLALACAAMGDVVAWCLLAAVSAAVTGGSGAGVAVRLLLLVGYSVLLVGPVRMVLARWQPGPAVLLSGLLLSAWVTDAAGVHALFGAFLFGLVVPRSARSPVRVAVEGMTDTVLLPVFFAAAGLATRFDLLSARDLGPAALVLVVAVGGKAGAVWVAARFSGASARTAAALGVLLNTRGLTEVVILGVGLSLDVLSPRGYAILVAMAVVTTVATAPLVRRLCPAGPADSPQPTPQVRTTSAASVRAAATTSSTPTDSSGA